MFVIAPGEIYLVKYAAHESGDALTNQKCGVVGRDVDRTERAADVVRRFQLARDQVEWKYESVTGADVKMCSSVIENNVAWIRQ